MRVMPVVLLKALAKLDPGSVPRRPEGEPVR